jgi:RNA polymerase sigma-70 factor (ECF subfamily)
MTADAEPDTDLLLQRAQQGDRAARGQLLERFQPRLRRMIALRLDRRLAARIDPSDVLQESLADAVEKLSDYLRDCPVPFYAWLRQLAWKRLIDLHRRHVKAQRRSVTREEAAELPLSHESALELVNRLIDRGNSPSSQLRRDVTRRRVRAALERLNERDREVLVLRHLEQLSTREIAAVLGITEGAFYTRHLRALERLQGLLGDDLAENVS